MKAGTVRKTGRQCTIRGYNFLQMDTGEPSDTGTILNYRSYAPLRHKKCIIQGTTHHLFRGTSNWEALHEALTKNEKIWEHN